MRLSEGTALGDGDCYNSHYSLNLDLDLGMEEDLAHQRVGASCSAVPVPEQHKGHSSRGRVGQ